MYVRVSVASHGVIMIVAGQKLWANEGATASEDALTEHQALKEKYSHVTS